MSEPIDLSQRRKPVHYTVRVTHHWNGAVEMLVEDVADDPRSRDAVAHALVLGVAAWMTADHVHKLLLALVDRWMDVPRSQAVTDDLRAVSSALVALEREMFPDMAGDEQEEKGDE